MDKDTAIVMDAKTIDLKKAKTITLTVKHQNGDIDIITDSQLRKLFDFIEQQAEQILGLSELVNQLQECRNCKHKSLGFDGDPCEKCIALGSDMTMWEWDGGSGE